MLALPCNVKRSGNNQAKTLAARARNAYTENHAVLTQKKPESLNPRDSGKKRKLKQEETENN